MKINARETEAFLKSPPPALRALLLYGPDGGLVRSRRESLTKHFLPSADAFNLIDLEEARVLADPAILADELSAMSLMGGIRVVRLLDAGDKTSKLIAEALESAGTSFLIVAAGELGPRSTLRLMFEKEAHLAAVACYKDEGRTLESFIRETLSKAGIQAEPDALRYLVSHLGNDRGISEQELAKIALYKANNGSLSLDEASLLIGQNDELSTDNLCQAVADGNLPALDEALNRLLLEGEHPVPILRAVTRYLLKLQAIQARLEAGDSLDMAIKSLRPPVFFKTVDKMMRQAPRWKPLPLTRALSLLLEAERRVKSGEIAPELVASRALMSIARAA